MASKGFRERILAIRENGAALANTTTPTNLLPASGQVNFIGAGYPEESLSIYVRATGRVSTLVTAPGTLALALRLGSVDVFSSGAMPLNIVAQTNTHWVLEGELVFTQVGTGSLTLLMPSGMTFKSHAVIGSPAPTVGGAGEIMLPYNTAPAVGSGFDASASQLISLMATWGTASASNSIQLHTAAVDIYSQ